jgi:pimeloyl-[acyl-carrier protein] methyl ester esterase
MNEWRLADGRVISYRQAGKGPTLVVLHGWAMSSAVFSEALQALSDEFCVLAPDLPGHGESSPAKDYGLDALAADLSAWMEGLQLAEVCLLGWSLGGQVTLRLASLAKQRISRLLLVATTPRFVADQDWPNGLAEGQVRIMARGLQRRFAKTLDDFFAQQFGEQELNAERRQWLIQQLSPKALPPQPDAAVAALETLRCSDLRSQLGELAVPALVMHGAEDGIVPPGAGRYLADMLPQARFQQLARAGHAPFLSYPEESFHLWREFCRL